MRLHLCICLSVCDVILHPSQVGVTEADIELLSTEAVKVGRLILSVLASTFCI